MLGPFALIFFLITIIIYFALTIAIVYHFKKYSISPRAAGSFMGIFLLVSLIFFILDFVFFARIPWQEVSQSIGNLFKDKFLFP